MSYYPSQYAYAAVQSVLAPLFGVKEAPFSTTEGGGRESVLILRSLWHRRARQLAEAGYRPLRKRNELQNAFACPHKLLAPDHRDAEHGCHHDAVCPFCWGERTAVAFANVLRARERRPECRLYLVRGMDLGDLRALPRVVGTWPGTTTDATLAAVQGDPALDLTQGQGGESQTATAWEIPTATLALARAVAWVRPYPTEALLGPVDDVVGEYETGAGRQRPRPDGVFRRPDSLRHLSQCRNRLIAPAAPGDPLPGHRLHYADLLASHLPPIWPHMAFVRRCLGPTVANRLSRFDWGGVFDLKARATMTAIWNYRGKAWRPLFAARRPGSEGVLCSSPGDGYFVLRHWSADEMTSGRIPVADVHGGLLIPPHGPDDYTFITFSYRRQRDLFEPVASWAWHFTNPLPAEKLRTIRTRLAVTPGLLQPGHPLLSVMLGSKRPWRNEDLVDQPNVGDELESN
jgi:hypothetical protein